MLSELERKRVWEGWLSAEIRANYFAELSSSYHRRQRGLAWAILVSSSGAVVGFLASLPAPWIYAGPGLAVVTAALSLYLAVTETQKKAMEAADLHYRWNKLAREHERLWANMYDAQAAETLETLEAQAMELSKIGTAFPAKSKALLKWQDFVERHHGLHAHA